MARNPERHAAAECTRRLHGRRPFARSWLPCADEETRHPAQPRQASWILNHAVQVLNHGGHGGNARGKKMDRLRFHRLMICINRHPVCRTLSGRIAIFTSEKSNMSSDSVCKIKSRLLQMIPLW